MKSVNRKSTPVSADANLDPLSMFVMESQEPLCEEEEEEYVAPPARRQVSSQRMSSSPVPRASVTPAPPAAPTYASGGSTKTPSFKRADELKDQLATLSSTFSSTISSISKDMYSQALAAATPAKPSSAMEDKVDEAPRAPISISRPATLDSDTLSAAAYNSSLQLTAQQQEAIDSFQYLSGEQKIMSIPHCVLQVFAYGSLSGLLFITNYRMVFLALLADVASIARNNPNIHSYLQVPLGCIDKIEREKRPKERDAASMTLLIHCKDCRLLRVLLKGNNSTTGDYELERVFNVLCAYAFPNNLRYVFAFAHALPVPKEGADLLSEFTRLGVMEIGGLRFTHANHDFRLCSTYPETLVVPASVADEELFSVAAFRAGHRLPALTWVKRDNGATLWRSSQPKSGMSGSSPQDERLLDCIARLGYNTAKYAHKRYNQELVLNIVDCRSRTSAMANRAAGAGYESQANYPSSRIDFFNIPNIHGVRDSFKALLGIVLNPTASPTADVSFSKQVDDTSWITNLRLIIKAGWDAASMLMSGQPVLVHCSHGWDRTAQVCALAQLFLDPYYRTMDGFAALVEKDWNSFGHTFYARCAQSQDKAVRADDEVSQIFIQFLDCVWQILKQFPHYFEFNAKYIVCIADHVYSCRFGTFLCSSDADRRSYKINQLTPDLWTFLKCNRETFTNNYFSERNHVLLPPLGQLLRGVALWSDYFLRYSTVHSLPSIPSHLAKYAHTVNDREQSADLAVLPLSTTTDYHEAIICKERTARLEVEQQLKAADLNIKAMILEMEEIIQGKLTEGEYSKFLSLKTRCLEQVVSAEMQLSTNHDLIASQEEEASSSTEDVVAPALQPEGESASDRSRKLTTDSISEADYVMPKQDDSHVASEFFV